MEYSNGAVILTAFLLPIITYLLYTRTRDVRPRAASKLQLPPPTEVTNLMVYPIKSCHGISVPSAKLLPTGLDLDRQWMWVTYPDYRFLTIRNLAKMTLIRPVYDAETDTLKVTAPAPNSDDEKLQFEIPAHPTREWLSKNTEVVNATVWSSTTPAYCFSPDLTGSFNAFFGKEVRLVYKPPFSDSPRALGSNGAKAVLGREASTCFPDMMPILVASEKSMEELNSCLQAAEGLSIPITRFRPNIIVRGTKAWDEDTWKTLRIKPQSSDSGDLVLDVTQRCARCQVPNVDSETAEKHKTQPWDTLMKYRRVDEGIKYKPCFGMLCVPRGTGGKMEVGMRLEVMEVTDKHRYIPGF
ncbi:MOSC-domain-containing protein [Westerdykella ornata]|uniref:MOSC-domain-containing protein n=1 Tax=Westerdykella ornata TaxID=318751 RepID=A0A6A6JLZ5_WESOR|nr:MOSC-domain-containing protein [Westerdykella ornata]KAF2277133.1 MOSC-domain-containing protein [Westerdykella ornata]